MASESSPPYFTANIETHSNQPMQVEVIVDGEAITQVPSLDSTHCQTWLHRWITELNPQQSPINAYEVSLRLTNDAEIQQLNSNYRQQDRPTDVLSFATLETALPGADSVYEEQPVYLGDIIVSVETAQRQAIQAQRSLTQEVAWLTAHGLLHLLGWDHPDDNSLTQMLAQQDRLLALVFIPDAGAPPLAYPLEETGSVKVSNKLS